MAGLKMRHDGCERKKYRLKFRCPLHSKNMDAAVNSPVPVRIMEEPFIWQ
jgi:hypothetical protein